MWIVWLIIGFVIGLLVTWFYLEAQYKRQSAERAGGASLQAGGGEKAIAHSQDSARISALQDEVRQRDGKIARLEADLADCRAKAAGTASPSAAMAAPAASSTGASPGAAPVHAAAAPAGDAGDDLTKIRGIGRVLKGKLNELGITTFQQIADFTEADIARVNSKLDFPGRIERERWVEQARDFARR